MIQAQRPLPAYVALDISKQHLIDSCCQIANYYGPPPADEAATGLQAGPQTGLTTIAICADYTLPLALPPLEALAGKARTAFFPGSTIGNLQPQEAVAFLGNIAQLVGPGGGLLIGVDLQKDQAVLEAAYDDAAGVSAAFALNLLQRTNRELAADFDLAQFRYRALYNSAVGRIEMYVESLQDQVVTVAGEAIAFQAGERLLTEHSYKYSPQGFAALVAQAGFTTQASWQDDQGLFLVSYCQVQPALA
ncbi:MAG: hypothetical protein HC824_00435 [Synechococcales cyanobacterium RM1_1_8]|nr:hypothetical protein [Synechococcales cyanobacterium RM1_1_8]